MNPVIKLRLLNNVLNSNAKQVRYNEDNYSLQLLNKIMHSGSFIPVTSMSLRPYVLSFVLNEVVINSRKCLIEFGAGISTVLLARLAKMNNLSMQIVSVEENAGWLKLINEILEREGLQQYVHLIHVPLEEKMFLGCKSHWYKQDVLQEALRQYKSFDLVLIDGPTACSEQIAMSRYFAVPFLEKQLADNHVILLDDANRDGEKKIMSLWKQESGKEFYIYAHTLGICYKGDHFESNPMKYIDIQKG